MEVHLLIYDLSRGLASQMSQGLLGFHLDAIYHTSIELKGREYVYQGGIQSIIPGSSHHGRPLERRKLGVTELPMDVVYQFVDSMRPVFTAQAYDLFKHNCNNWSDTFAKFLLGTGIPDHIVNMPQAVMDSPMGRMLISGLDSSVDAGSQSNPLFGRPSAAAPPQNHQPVAPPVSPKVRTVTNLQELDAALAAGQGACAAIIFTSATCPPCKTLYPIYEELASTFEGKATLIKVDISRALDVGNKYQVRATPTIMTFLFGKKDKQWSGADPSALRSNIQALVLSAFPPHPHESLNLPSLSGFNSKPVLFAKVPPLPKLLAKMGSAAQDPAVQTTKHFIETRAASGATAAILPDMQQLSSFLQRSAASLAPDVLFSVVDLFRCALVDPRVSAYFAEEKEHQTVVKILDAVNNNDACPYALRLVTLQLACNLFSTPLYADPILHDDRLRSSITQLISTSFLDDSHNNVRVAASSLLFDLSLINGQARRRGAEGLPEGDQIELAASVLEAISQEEESPEALQGMLLALGYLVYCSPVDGELADLLRTMDAEDTILGKKKKFPSEKLVTEVGSELLGKGLRR
ncbi:PUL domain-containing protein [Plectosphaerella plurivora]|uniref:PUL domain-containing protein n=1 Tax=Plectosphaerella plurivora TaxID=936078 RepID=A0A9P8VBV9_9PEZI|nr:PUL domain-containing protein [Plectosphaerella plurivora]